MFGSSTAPGEVPTATQDDAARAHQAPVLINPEDANAHANLDLALYSKASSMTPSYLTVRRSRSTQHMHSIGAGTRIIVCTGFSHLADGDGAKAAGVKAFAMKPLMKRDIGRTIEARPRRVVPDIAPFSE